MPSRNIGDWFGWKRSPAAMAAALAGSSRNAPPVAIMAVTTKHETAESTGNSINCLSERRMAKLCLTSSQLRENLPIAPSQAIGNDGTRIVWPRGLPVPIVRSIGFLRTGNASDNGYPSWNSRASAEMGVEPGDGAADAVALVLGADEQVAFVLVDHELGFDAKSFQGVPEFVRLRRGAFPVTVADDHQGGRFHVLDEGDRRAFPVDLGIVVNRLAEKRDHPLVDFVLSIVAEPVGDACPGHGGFEAVSLRDAPHGHEAAIAPAGQAEAAGIDGSDAKGFIHTGKDVTKIAVPEIADVGLRESFALPEAASRIALKNKVAGAREGHREAPRIRPSRLHRRARAAVNYHDQGIFFRGIEIAGIGEPALHIVAIVFPVEALGFSPSGFHGGIAMRELPPVADGARPDFRRVSQRTADNGGRFSVARESDVGAPRA